MTRPVGIAMAAVCGHDHFGWISIYLSVAQRLAHLIEVQGVVGSNPTAPDPQFPGADAYPLHSGQ